MNKPKKASTLKPAPIAVQDSEKTSVLPLLSEKEMQEAWNKARIAENIHEPVNLRTVWAKKKTAGVQDLLGMIRKVVNFPAIDKPEQTADYLARLLEAAVERFENLVQTGAMDEVLPRLTALPVLYSRGAGKGALEWERARSLFDDKKVGTKSVSAHVGNNPAAARNPIWGMLAVDAVQVASRAALQLPILDAYKEKAIAVGHKRAKRPGAKKYFWRGSVYLLADKGVLIWPDWLSECRGLPNTVKENVEGYQAACGLILKDFFGDPGNKWGEELLKAKTENAIHPSAPADARKQAVETVVAVVGRLGV